MQQFTHDGAHALQGGFAVGEQMLEDALYIRVSKNDDSVSRF